MIAAGVILALGGVTAGVALAVSSGNARNAQDQVNAARASATTCMAAIGFAEQTALTTSEAIAGLAAGINAASPGAVADGVNEIVAKQQRAQTGLAACVTDDDAPKECTHSATALMEVSSEQAKQAQQIAVAARESTSGNGPASSKAVDAVAGTQKRIQDLADSVDDGACGLYAIPDAATS